MSILPFGFLSEESARDDSIYHTYRYGVSHVAGQSSCRLWNFAEVDDRVKDSGSSKDTEEQQSGPVGRTCEDVERSDHNETVRIFDVILVATAKKLRIFQLNS